MTSPDPQTGSSPIERLPTELLLQIAKCISNRDLVSLACVKRQFRSIAEDALYEDVVLLQSVGFRCSMKSFLDALRCRPHFAQKVLRLSISINDGYIDYTLSNTFAASSESLSQWSSHHPDLRCTVWEPSIAGTILSFLPNLQTLDLSTNKRIHTPISECLFGEDTSPSRQRVLQIAAFRHLTELDWTCDNLEEEIACLPSLRRMSIAEWCHMPDTTSWSSAPTITRLELERTSSVLPVISQIPIPDHPHFKIAANQHTVGFLRMCHHLTHLRISIADHHEFEGDPFLTEHTNGDLNEFVKDFSKATPALEELSISADGIGYSNFLRYIRPLQTLCGFQNLRTATLTESMLLGPDAHLNSADPSTTLPRHWRNSVSSFPLPISSTFSRDCCQTTPMVGSPIFARSRWPPRPTLLEWVLIMTTTTSGVGALASQPQCDISGTHRQSSNSYARQISGRS